MSPITQIVLMAIVMYSGLILIPQICEHFAKVKQEKENKINETIICPHMLQFT